MRKLTNKLTSDVGNIKKKKLINFPIQTILLDLFHNATYLVYPFPSKTSRTRTCSRALYSQLKKKKIMPQKWDIEA